jgi:acetyl-CoA decarbonylase/synthase complex subunit gamma
MGLSGLEIYKLLPKTNCKACGFPTCLAFAMQLAAKKISLDKCPYVSEEAKKALESASQPPIKLVTIGTGEKKLEAGNETVMFRHEQTFYHPTGIGILIEDSLSNQEIKEKIKKINALSFERVGQKIAVDLVAVKQTHSKEKFIETVKEVSALADLGLVLISQDKEALSGALKIVAQKKPLLCAAQNNNLSDLANLAKTFQVPLVVEGKNLEELSELSKTATQTGCSDIVLDSGVKPLNEKLWDLTQIRRLALKKLFRPLGFPTISFIDETDSYQAALETISLIAKYSSIVILKQCEAWEILPVLTARQNIFTDPQKPLQVEAKIYEIGNVSENSPVLVTTNFSLSYYSVEPEVEASRIPARIIAVNTDGMSVLTAWAADKFTAETIAKALSDTEIKAKIKHQEVVIPGYVAVLSGALEETCGMKVLVGPREAAGISAFLKSRYKA